MSDVGAKLAVLEGKSGEAGRVKGLKKGLLCLTGQQVQVSVN